MGLGLRRRIGLGLRRRVGIGLRRRSMLGLRRRLGGLSRRRTVGLSRRRTGGLARRCPGLKLRSRFLWPPSSKRRLVVYSTMRVLPLKSLKARKRKELVKWRTKYVSDAKNAHVRTRCGTFRARALHRRWTQTGRMQMSPESRGARCGHSR